MGFSFFLCFCVFGRKKLGGRKRNRDDFFELKELISLEMGYGVWSVECRVWISCTALCLKCGVLMYTILISDLIGVALR